MSTTDPTRAEATGFLLANTSRQRPHYVPEVELHLARDSVTVWQRLEAQNDGVRVEPPYWAQAWAGGQAVSRYVLDHPEVVAGRTVLDLASGSGLCAIAAMKAGARSVLASDIDPYAVAAIAANAALNDVTVEATARDLLVEEPPAVDVVMAGDVCYELSMATVFLAWLRRAQDAGAQVLLGDPGRDFLPAEGLVERARYDIAGDPVLENLGIDHAGVFSFE